MRDTLRYVDWSSVALLGAVIFVAATVTMPCSDALLAGTDGRGPVLEAALAAGWRPGPPPKRDAHACSMCVKCCERCNVKDECCCRDVDRCACPPNDGDPTVAEGELR